MSKWMVRVSLMAAIASAGMAAHAATLDGTWQVNGDVQGNPVVTTCVLTVVENKIGGTCLGTDGAARPVDGTVADGTMKWSYDSVYDGTKITLNYTAKLKGDDGLEGTIFVDPYEADGSFTATRKKATT
ncbi:hypothetical protein [Granulicella arctica]|uniref:hypothetical protein n=1 Tax=Granulicella arctica TaxID=940613 RepID=UPI0021E085EB|nr:hypothetical protein [Granulicella arctica]